MDELKPCPFCGSKAYIHKGKLYSYGKCLQCGAESSAQTNNPKAIAAWNTRVESRLSALQQSHDRLLGVARFLVKNCTAESYSPWSEALQKARAAIAEATPE